MVSPHSDLPVPPAIASSASDAFEVMVPCFLKVIVRGEDEHEAEHDAVELARKLGVITLPEGTVTLGSIMTPMARKIA